MMEVCPRVRFDITVASAPGWREPPRLLYDCELVYVTEGSFQLRIEEQAYTLGVGDAAIIGPYVEHESWTKPGQRVVRKCLHFDWNRSHSHITAPLFCLGSMVYEAKYMHPVDSTFECCSRMVSPAERNGPILPVLDDVFERLEHRDTIGTTLMYSVLHYFLDLQSSGESTSVPFASSSNRVMLELKHYIDAHYNKPLTLELFSERTRLSRSHLCQAFRKCIGMPPIHYLIRLRLEHACRLLQESNLNVDEIGRQVGFPNVNYFVRSFKQHRGTTPGAYARRVAPAHTP